MLIANVRIPVMSKIIVTAEAIFFTFPPNKDIFLKLLLFFVCAQIGLEQMRKRVVYTQFCLIIMLLDLFLVVCRNNAMGRIETVSALSSEDYQWGAHEYIHNIDIREDAVAINEIRVTWIRLQQGFDLRDAEPFNVDIRNVCWLIKEQDAQNIKVKDATFGGDLTIRRTERNSLGTYVYFKWAPYSWQGWINKGGTLGLQFTYETMSLSTKQGIEWTTSVPKRSIRSMYSDYGITRYPFNKVNVEFILPETSKLLRGQAQGLLPSYGFEEERLTVTFSFRNGNPGDYSPYEVKWTTHFEKFNPKTNGFGFPNPSLTPRVIQSLIDILVSLQVSPVTPKISESMLAWIIYFLERDSKGLCGGMVDSAIDYFENPYKIPNGFTRLVDVPQNHVQDAIENYQVAQFFDAHGLLKHLLLRLDDNPSGLLSLDDEVAWINQQTNQNKPVKLIVIDPDFGFFSAHAVLVYDVLKEENNVIMKLYGPNRPREEQWIELTYDEFGRLEIVNGAYPVDGFEIARFASENGPTSLDWRKVTEYIDTLITELIERLKEEFGEAISLVLHSPTQLHVYDPEGKHVGLTSEGEEVEFDALYSVDSKGAQYCVIPNPKVGSYNVEVYGIDEGDFTLTVSSTFEKATASEEIISGEIRPDVTYFYKIDLKDDGTFSILNVTPSEIIPLWMLGLALTTMVIVTAIMIVWRKRSSKRK